MIRANHSATMPEDDEYTPEQLDRLARIAGELLETAAERAFAKAECLRAHYVATACRRARPQRITNGM